MIGARRPGVEKLPRVIFYSSLILLFSAPSVFATRTSAVQPKKHARNAQMQPSPERIAEIQSALKAHGYEPGSTWEETQEVCRKIADEHQWQTDHAPDARVLILLGLAGPYANPAVAQMQGGRLDNDQRAEAARIHSQPVTHYSLRASAEDAPPKTASRREKTKTPLVTSRHTSKKKLARHSPENRAKRTYKQA